MTAPRQFRTLPPRRGALALAAAAALTAGLLAGCSSDGADTDCSFSDCTITFDRTAEASTSVLGIDVELVSSEDGQATVAVGGQEVTVQVDGSQQVAGMTVEVRSVSAEEVVVNVSR